MSLDFQFRPLPVWPYKTTKNRRDHPFKVPYAQTLEELDNALWHYRARGVIMAIGLGEYDIRQDGLPRANARAVSHPGVELSFDAWIDGRWKRLSFHTDVCTTWQDNVRSILLGLKALRAVDLHGISETGQQYAGFAALPAGESLVDLGRRLVAEHGGIKEALRFWHPDSNASSEAQRNTQGILAFRQHLEENA